MIIIMPVNFFVLSGIATIEIDGERITLNTKEGIGEMVIMTKELFVNGELTLSRKETYGKSKQTKSVPVFTSRMEKREYYKSVNHFDIRNVLDVKGFLKDIRANWNTYVSQVNQWIQKNPVKKLVVTGIFTVVLGFFASTANAAFHSRIHLSGKKW